MDCKQRIERTNKITTAFDSLCWVPEGAELIKQFDEKRNDKT